MSGSEVTLQDVSPNSINVNFNNEEIAGREPEPVLFDENRKSLDINYKPFGKGLVMASLNINSLLAHIDELMKLMNQLMKQNLITQLMIMRFIYRAMK